MSPDAFHLDEDGELLEAESLRLPAVAASVPLARHTVADRLSTWDLDDLVFPCTQVVTELAANSVAETERTSEPRGHASETFTVQLLRTSTYLLVKVGDISSQPPKPRTATEQDTNGRGLALVEVLADHWGWHPATPTGKVVYAAWKLPASPVAAPMTEVVR